MKANNSYKYRLIAGQHYLIPTGLEAIKHEAPLQLTETAAWIWTEVCKGTPKVEIAIKMTDVYDVDLSTAESAVCEFITELIRQGLLGIDDSESDNSIETMETEYDR